jgi:CheY-like chemotaxis protein
MMKILVIENHADMREILVKILDLMGFTAITSRNGKGCREGFGRETGSDRDGHHDARNLWVGGDSNAAQHPQTKDIPVLAATVLFRPSDLQRWITVGCNDYIVKPFTVRQLRRKIERLI